MTDTRYPTQKPINGHACYLASRDADMVGFGVVLTRERLNEVHRHNADVQIRRLVQQRRARQNKTNRAARKRNAAARET